MKVTLKFFLLALLCIAPSVNAQAQKINKKDLKAVVRAMSGEFSSAQQASADSAFFHVMLRMKRFKKAKKYLK